ncbi:MAG TPA: ROK family transcriptional regulator [Candidatus Aerophobetes bacterium]|uniref:ROK family transcriptional regulator n=1 Tax=Aerophobetes bacterium TaxID=2030807 RepID=A0A7V5HY09_UNCAE|nr:ROK family transcriptional regulator [Candidatus Aerophobetes bacterium]
MMDTGRKPQTIKRMNKALILRTINKEGAISRAELSRKTSLSMPTIMKIVDELKEEGLIIEAGVAPSIGGRPPKVIKLNPKGAYAIGVKILPNELRVVVANLRNNFVARRVETISPFSGYRKILAQLKDAIREVTYRSRVNFRQILGIGIGVPGIVNSSSNGKVIFAPNLRGWENVSLASDIEKEFDVPVFIENEARVSALAEKWYGIARGVENFVCIDVAVGIGAGIVIDGELYRGHGNLAGEIGHLVVVKNGPVCNCGKRGCLETVASNTAIINMVRNNPTSTIMRLCKESENSITMKEIIKAVKVGDKECEKYIKRAAVYLGRAIGYLINIIDPEMIIINGEITLAGDVFFDPLKREIDKSAFRAGKILPKIVTSGLGEDVGLIGASSLVIRNIFKGPRKV